MRSRNYQFGLLYLAHLLISADGVIDANEFQALAKIKQRDEISDEVFKEFEQVVMKKKEIEIYKEGIDLISTVSDEEKLRAFAHLYKMSEIDGRVHVKEVRLLLYSVRQVGIEFNDVVTLAKSIQNY